MKRRHHSQRSGHVEMGTCPLCGRTISTDQPTTWRLVDGSPARLHASCVLAHKLNVG